MALREIFGIVQRRRSQMIRVGSLATGDNGA
jgi:hypothetical protein